MFLKYNLEKEIKSPKHKNYLKEELSTVHKSLSSITKEYKAAKIGLQKIFVKKKDILTDFDKYFHSSK